MRSKFLAFAALLTVCLAMLAPAALAADATFVGKLALITDPEVAKELGLSDDTKQKLLALIDKRESEAVAVAQKIRSLPAAKQAEQLAPFVAESEKLGLALLDDSQIAKLNKLRVAKEGMLGVLAPDIAGKLQITPEQQKEIDALLKQHKTSSTTGNEFQKRMARQVYDRKIAAVLNETQRASWEQLSGVPAGGGGGAPAPAPAAQASNGSAPATGSGQGGVTVERATAGAAQLNVNEDGLYRLSFEFTPWKSVLEYFAKQGGYSFATDIYPPGTLNYTDPKHYTAEQVIDILNLHLMTKGFILVKRENLLRLFDVDNNGPVPPEFVPQISPDELPERGQFELVTCQFQLNRWSPAEAETEIRKLLGRYGTIIVLGPARQVMVTDLGGKLRSIKKTIDAVEQPDAPKDDEFSLIRLNKLTPTEFLTTCRQLFGIPENQFATSDGALRLSINELDSVVYAYGKSAMIDRIKRLAKEIDQVSPTRAGPGGIQLVEQPQFGVYQIMFADPAHVENVLRTLLAGNAPDMRIQLDPKSSKIAVWARRAQHEAIQAIINEMEQNGNVTEVIKLKKLDPQTAATGINQLFSSDPTGRTASSGLRVSPDAYNYTLTLSGTPAMVEAAKGWLAQMGELGGGASGNSYVGADGQRASRRVIPLSNRTIRNILDDAQSMWSSQRATLNVIDEVKKAAEAAKQETKDSGSKAGGKPAPTKDDITQSARKPAVLFVSEPPQAEPADEDAADEQAKPAEVPAVTEGTLPGHPEIKVQVTPAGIVISSDDLDALDEFQSLLQELVEADDRRGKRTETFPLRYKDAEIAYSMLKAMMDGGANVSSGLSGLSGNMFGGGGVGGLAGMLLGGGGGASSSAGGTVSGTASGTPATIVPDPNLNVLYITALPRDLDNIEQLIKLIDKEESDVPPEPMKRRFIPVQHAKAADVATIVREQFAGQIYSESGGQRGGGRGGDPAQALIMAALGGGNRGGRGGPGGGLLGRSNQPNLGEKPKMMISVATDSNALVVTAPDHLFNEVENFVKALDQEFENPDQSVAVVPLIRTNTDVAFQNLGAMLGPNATIVRVLPINNNNNRGGQNNQNRATTGASNNQGGNRQGGNQQLSQQGLQRLQQFNQGQGNRGGGGPQTFGGANQGGGNFGGRGGGTQGFGGGGNNFGGRSGGGPQTFGGGNRGGGSPQGGNFGGGNRGGGNTGGRGGR
jgi:type II secretory pathway component GspD/PulD (secretin)